jgi:hypothetical protein
LISNGDDELKRFAAKVLIFNGGQADLRAAVLHDANLFRPTCAAHDLIWRIAHA